MNFFFKAHISFLLESPDWENVNEREGKYYLAESKYFVV